MTKQKDVTIDPLTGLKYHLKKMTDHHYRIYVLGQGLMQSTDIIFAANHTVICGDLCPGRNGVVSNPGYGIDFFSKPRGSNYLAEKFLSQGYHKELALDGLVDLIKDHEVLTKEAVEELKGFIEDDDSRQFFDWFLDHDFEAEDIPGWGYNPQERHLLSLINRRFAALIGTVEDG